MNDLLELYRQQVLALQSENRRLNDELKKFKELAFKTRLSDPAFDKPISEIETNFEIVEK